MKGIFGSMLDLNHDGNISPLESVMEFTFLNELLKDDSDVQTELELSGLDPDELEFMDVDERRKALEDAGNLENLEKTARLDIVEDWVADNCKQVKSTSSDSSESGSNSTGSTGSTENTK